MAEPLRTSVGYQVERRVHCVASFYARDGRKTLYSNLRRFLPASLDKDYTQNHAKIL